VKYPPAKVARATMAADTSGGRRRAYPSTRLAAVAVEVAATTFGCGARPKSAAGDEHEQRDRCEDEDDRREVFSVVHV
jgi:hypothetical protein